MPHRRVRGVRDMCDLGAPPMDEELISHDQKRNPSKLMAKLPISRAINSLQTASASHEIAEEKFATRRDRLRSIVGVRRCLVREATVTIAAIAPPSIRTIRILSAGGCDRGQGGWLVSARRGEG